jgi:hypothetical protein
MPQRLSDVLMTDLVPETQAWNDGKGIDLEAWIGCEGRLEYAIAYGELFWPDFTEHDGCVFFAGFNEDSYRGFMQQTGGNRQAVEAVMNHSHIIDLFPGSRPAREQVVYFGRLLREIWATKLAHNFPDRKFVVSFTEEPSEDLLDYEVTFYQKQE